MKEIKFSLHCLEKIVLLKRHNFSIENEFVIDAILNPDSTSIGKVNRKIAQKILDENHVLRVIYEDSEDEILIITLYPGRRKRYEEN